MRKQSIATRKYLDRLAKDDPKHLEEIKHRRRLSSAKSFIRLHARKEELGELKKIIEEKQKNS